MANDANVRRPFAISPFYLIVADHDRGFLLSRRPDDRRPAVDGRRSAGPQHNQRHVVCGPTGPDPAALAVEYQKAHKLAGVPPGSIVRPER
jgi:hypothetical protein